MAIYINKLNGGNITIGSSGGSAPTGHPETRFTLQDGTVETYNITGTLNKQWFIDNGYFDEDAGMWLKSITQVDIGNTITSIDNETFNGCSGLMLFIVSDDNTNYKSVNGLLLSKDGKTLIAGVNGDVTIPSGVTTIGDYAFYDYSGLTSVEIPNGVTNIGNGVFSACYSLMSVTIPDSVTSIGNYAFSGCSGLTSVTIPDSVTSIRYGAFEDCGSLTTITVMGKTTADAQTLLANAAVPAGCTIVGELG